MMLSAVCLLRTGRTYGTHANIYPHTVHQAFLAERMISINLLSRCG